MAIVTWKLNPAVPRGVIANLRCVEGRSRSGYHCDMNRTHAFVALAGIVGTLVAAVATAQPPAEPSEIVYHRRGNLVAGDLAGNNERVITKLSALHSDDIDLGPDGLSIAVTAPSRFPAILDIATGKTRRLSKVPGDN